MFVPVKSVHNHDTRNAEFGFHPVKKNLTAGTKSFSHSGCQIWNKLPKDAQASPSLRDFKTRAFKFFKDQGQTLILIKLHRTLEDQALLERLPWVKMIK